MANKNGGLWGDEQFCNLHCHWENRGFSVPQIECVSLWEPSAHTAGPDWLLRPLLGCFSLPGWGGDGADCSFTGTSCQMREACRGRLRDGWGHWNG